MQYKFIIHNYSIIQDAIKSNRTNVPLEHILGIYDDFSVSKICKPELVSLYKRFHKLFLYYYNGTIDLSDFSKETINLINTDDLSYLIFWATHEPHSYWNAIETQLQSFGINLDKVIFISSDDCPNSKYKHIFADNWWEAYYRYHVRTNCNVSVRPPHNIKITNYDKKALSLNRNLRPFRVWNYFALVSSGLGSQSHVSYHLPKIKEDQLKYSKIIPFEFEDCVEIAQKEIPEQLKKKFINNTKIREVQHLDSLDYVYNYKDSIVPYYESSAYSIVTESILEKTFITEKTFKPITHSHPFLSVANKGNTEYLKSNGYELYTELFDIDYIDNFDDALKIYTRLARMNKQELDKKLLISKEKVIHNWNNFFNRTHSLDELVSKIIRLTNSTTSV